MPIALRVASNNSNMPIAPIINSVGKEYSLPKKEIECFNKIPFLSTISE